MSVVSESLQISLIFHYIFPLYHFIFPLVTIKTRTRFILWSSKRGFASRISIRNESEILHSAISFTGRQLIYTGWVRKYHIFTRKYFFKINKMHEHYFSIHLNCLVFEIGDLCLKKSVYFPFFDLLKALDCPRIK